VVEMYSDSRGLQTAVTEDTPTEQVIAWTLERFADQRMLMTTSFGMEGCALIDMYARAETPLKVVYLDTMFFFPETYELRERMVERYPHIEFVNRGTKLTPEEQANRYGHELWKRNPDFCCKLRKIDPMVDVMADVDLWITGLRRKLGSSGGLPPFRSTDVHRLGSAIATLRIDSVETAVWCGRLARNDDVIGPNNVEGWHVRPNAPVESINGLGEGGARSWRKLRRRDSRR